MFTCKSRAPPATVIALTITRTGRRLHRFFLLPCRLICNIHAPLRCFDLAFAPRMLSKAITATSFGGCERRIP